ncbi:MAG: TetR/AcrR family transcriptional regulator [Cellvibrionaceae bacterium]
MAYRPTEKTKAHRAAQHDSLMSAAIAIVAESGFQGLTISALAQKAEIATGTVYKYFESKAHLCAEVFKQATEKEVEQVRIAALDDNQRPCRQRLIQAIQVFSERALRGDRLAYALIAEPVDPAVEAERLVYRQAYASIYADLVREGIRKKEFPEQNVEITATALVGVIAETIIAPLGRRAGIEEASPRESGIQIQDPSKASEQLLCDIQQFCLRAVTGMPC